MQQTLQQGNLKLIAAAIVLVSAAMSAPSATAQTFTLLHTFGGGATDGYQPQAGLVQATNGDLYGTTSSGGSDDNGVVFKVSPSGTVTTVLSFDYATNNNDGSQPYAGLVQDSNGDLYGTTDAGGTSAQGTVFKMTLGGALTTLVSFSANADGSFPRAAMIRASNGSLYGTTYLGGNNGVGVVFKMTASGKLTTVHSFNGSSDGGDPVAGLVQAANGDFYGTTYYGGASGAGTGTGTVFKLTTRGKYTTLFSFCEMGVTTCTDGSNPAASLVHATNGNLYGTTANGGANGYGSVFKISPAGTFATVHSFDFADGATPVAGLIQATDGNFYGTTSGGGAAGAGTVFSMTPAGAITTLYMFCSQANCADGGMPNAGLLQATDGNFYGTTFENVSGSGGGTVFKLSTGLSPFVEPQTTSGKVGTSVKILGSDLTGATSVTFNGTTATFTVATSGSIAVTTPRGTLDGNKIFTVKT
jgi:uncharacterized repeat protein (TIGR03803 family)